MLLSRKKIVSAVLLLATLRIAAACLGLKRRSGPKVQLVASHRKSSYTDEDFIRTVQEKDVKYIPYTLDPFTLKHHREWQTPLARAYHLIAVRLGIDNWAGHGYVWFAAGGQEAGVIPSHREKTRVYKIHLMPQDDTMADFAFRLGKIIMEDQELYNHIIYYKFLVRPEMHEMMPRVVLYLDGKEDAQHVLNILYEKLRHEPGSGHVARFSAYVTDLIWVAQGNGDQKRDVQFQSDYEQPHLIYYKKDFSGEDRDYYLKHPATGENLVSSYRPKV